MSKRRWKKNCMDGWINIWKYWEELVIKIEWHSSASKFIFELEGAIWVLSLDSAKDIWHLLTKHDSFSFLSLIKFNKVFKKKPFDIYTFSVNLKIVAFRGPGRTCGHTFAV